MLDPASHIDDPVFAVSLPVQPLLHAAKADDVIARALLAKHNPVLEAARAQDREQGRNEGATEATARALLWVLASRGLSPTASERQLILAEREPDRLERWLAVAATCERVAELLAR